MNIIEISRLDEIKTYEAVWHDITSAMQEKNINHDFNWIYLLYRYFGNHQNNRFYLIKDGDNVLGFIPLIRCIRKKYKFINIIEFKFIGVNYEKTDFCDFIVQNNIKKCIEEFLNFIISKKNQWNTIEFKYLTEGQSNINYIRDVLSQSNLVWEEKVCTKVFYINLNHFGGWEHYYNKLSRNLRRELTKRLYKFETYKEYQYIENPSMSVTEMVNIINNLYNKRQGKMGRKLYTDDIRLINFLYGVINTYKDNGLLFTLIYLEQKPISFTLGFIDNDMYWHWSIGFDTDFEHLSPNKVHHRFLIESCFNKGLREFNFMRGDSEYKKYWTKTWRDSYYIKIHNNFTLLNWLSTKYKLFTKHYR